MDKKSALEYDPKNRDSGNVEEEVGALSSRVLEMLRIKGKVTKPGPMASDCDVDGDDASEYRIVRHPWSVYGVGNDILQEGMRNLVAALPEQGWKVVKYGKDSSKNQNLEVLAVHPKTYTQLEATWMKGLDGHEAMISIDLYSRCFRDSSDTASSKDQ